MAEDGHSADPEASFWSLLEHFESWRLGRRWVYYVADQVFDVFHRLGAAVLAERTPRESRFQLETRPVPCTLPCILV